MGAKLLSHPDHVITTSNLNQAWLHLEQGERRPAGDREVEQSCLGMLQNN